MAAGPTLIVEVAFTTDALSASPSWEDITDDVRAWDVQRGRNRELEPFQPGRATVVLSNLERQYDSVYSAGPHFGDLKPMRRIRIRETYNAVTYPIFDGFIDRWALDYPGSGKDAVAVVTATDAFKILARTELPRSVYHQEVEADSPVLWWFLDEQPALLASTTTVLNHGTGGATYDGLIFGGAQTGGDSLIVRDPGASMRTTDSTTNPGTPDQGAGMNAASFLLNTPWAFELWCVPQVEAADATGDYLINTNAAAGGETGSLVYVSTSSNRFTFSVVNSVSTTFSVSSAGNKTPWTRYHIVVKHGPDRVLSMYVNGVKTTGDTTTGNMPDENAAVDTDFRIGHHESIADPGLRNWRGLISEVAVYTAGAGVDPLSDARVAAHYAAGTAPWQGDQPDDRLGRILDLADWPSALRDLDSGNVALQSADLGGASVLDHAQHVADTEFGLLFISADGKVRFIDRSGQIARAPADSTVFGDSTGEVGYRAFVPDDGDEVIRNRATISRLNGVAQTVEDSSSVSEFGRFQFTLDGLLHRFDSFSADYADLIVDEYAQPHRRITSLTLGPAGAGAETTLYPQMLGRELGDAINVKNRPPGGGSAFSQMCVIEGISHAGEPGGIRTTTWALSPTIAQDWLVLDSTSRGILNTNVLGF